MGNGEDPAVGLGDERATGWAISWARPGAPTRWSRSSTPTASATPASRPLSGPSAAWRRGRVLDIAVGAGRTTGLLSRYAATYVGVDIAESMVDLARERFPDVDLRVGDARDLERPRDAAPSTSWCSATTASTRSTTTTDDWRCRPCAGCVAPSGRVVLSTFNIDGVSFDERPWTRARARAAAAPGCTSRSTSGTRWPGCAASGATGGAGTESEDGDGWARRPMRALDFRFVAHFATLGSTVGMLREEGLEPVVAFTEQGEPVDLAEERMRRRLRAPGVPCRS